MQGFRRVVTISNALVAQKKESSYQEKKGDCEISPSKTTAGVMSVSRFGYRSLRRM